MRIAIGSDHGGFYLKEEIKQLLTNKNIAFRDVGTSSTAAVDYPDIARMVGEMVVSGECQRGILLCGTGIGVCIAANKIKGIRAALCHDVYSARMSRAHNDANVLTMGARVIGSGLAGLIVEEWLAGEFAGDRHARRLDKITALERGD